jgi:hypothetical protein
MPTGAGAKIAWLTRALGGALILYEIDGSHPSTSLQSLPKNRGLTRMENTLVQPVEGGHGFVLYDDKGKPCVEFAWGC